MVPCQYLYNESLTFYHLNLYCSLLKFLSLQKSQWIFDFSATKLPVVKIRAPCFHFFYSLPLVWGFFLIGNSLVQELSLAMFVKYIAEWGINPTWGFSCCCVARQNILAPKSPIKIFFLLLSVIAISGKKKAKNPTKSKSNLVTRSIFHLNGQKSKDLIW